MHQIFRTLRFKLVVLYFLTFGTIHVIMSIVGMEMRRRDLIEDLDSRLAEHAHALVNATLPRAGNPQIAVTDARSWQDPSFWRLRMAPLESIDLFAQLRGPGGSEILQRSPNLGSKALPWTESAMQTRDAPIPSTETITGTTAAALVGPDTELRMLTLAFRQREGKPMFLQVGTSLAPTEKRLRSLRQISLTLLPISLLAAGFASWILVRRSLAPIGRIAREARELTAAHLERRIAEPSGHDEVAEMVRTINQMLERLHAAFDAQERFIANAAHELKTPLSVILGQAQIMRHRARTPEEHARFIASVEDETKQLAQVVDSLLMLSRADAGLPLPVMADVSINEVVTDAVQRFDDYARKRAVRLVPTLALSDHDESEPVVPGDVDLLHTMISNLIRNAMHYSPPGEAVEIDVHMQGDWVDVTVRDRGPGIPQEHIPRLFERFFQVPRAGQQPKGTGLGLAIARGIAKLHHGEIAVSNRADRGCEFMVRLPTVKAGSNGKIDAAVWRPTGVAG